MLRSLSVILIATVLFIMPEYALASNQIPRPLHSVEAINTIYDNATTDNVASVGVTVNLTRYDASGWGPDLNFQAPFLNVMTTANTREGIHYNSTTDEYSWHSTTTDPMLGALPSSDNTVYGPINLICPVRYYGGPGDCEYNAIWISTNGWISFYDPTKSAPSAAPIVNFPYQGNPSALVLLYSGYLYPSRGGAIRYGEVTQPSYFANNGVNCFCVSWDGVPDSNGSPQSFQVLIEQSPQNLILYPRQSRIWFQYQQINVNPQSYLFVGLGDQQGCKAVTCLSTSLQNQTQALLFGQMTTQVAAYVSSIKVTMSTLGDNTAYTIIDHNDNHIRGYNLQMNTSLPPQDPYNTFAGTMAEDGIGLLENVWEIAVPAYVVPGAGIVLGCAMIGYDAWKWASEQTAAAQLFQTNWQDCAAAQAANDNFGTTGSFGHVEARLGMVVYWLFKDVSRMCNHTLTITATLNYYTMDALGSILGTHTLQASVTITVFYPYGHNGFDTAWVMTSGMYTDIGYIDEVDEWDYYKVMVPQGYKLDVTMYPPTPPNSPAAFTISLYDQNKNPVASATSNSTREVSYV